MLDKNIEKEFENSLTRMDISKEGAKGIIDTLQEQYDFFKTALFAGDIKIDDETIMVFNFNNKYTNNLYITVEGYSDLWDLIL